MGRVPALVLGIPLVHREAVDPQVRQDVLVGQPEPPAELRAQPSEHVVGRVRRVRDDQHEVARARAGRGREPLGPVVAEELPDRALDGAGVLDGHVGEALRAEPLGELHELVDLAPARARHAGDGDPLDEPAARERVVEDPEARRGPAVGVRQRGSEIRELHAEPQVGLVRAVAVHRLGVREARERRLLDRPLGHDLARDLDDHRLDEVHDRGLVDEAHLEVELRELGLPVAAEVLVAEAPRDLVVAVDARDHQELLELLRALGQGVDLAGPEPARDEEVAGTFGRRLHEIGRLDLDEPGALVRGMDRVHEPAPEDEAARDRLAAQVEVAVLEPERLVDLGVGIVDVERRRLRLVEDLDAGRLDLDLAGRELRVLGARQALRDGPDDGHHELGPHEAARLVGGRCIGPVDDHLGDPVPVPEVEEDQAALVAPAVHPAGQSDLAPGVGRAQLAARVRAVGAREQARVGRSGHGPGMVFGAVSRAAACSSGAAGRSASPPISERARRAARTCSTARPARPGCCTRSASWTCAFRRDPVGHRRGRTTRRTSPRSTSGRLFVTVILGSHLVNVPDADLRRGFLDAARRHLVGDCDVLVEHHPVDWAATAEPPCPRRPAARRA